MSTDTTDKSRILSRIKKLLTLAHDSAATEGERDNALRAAHATLAKYNLSLAEVDSNTSPDDPRLKHVFVTRDLVWMRTCAFAIARLFFCEYFYTLTRGQPGSKRMHHSFIGRSTNAVTAQDMTSYIITSILAEARRVTRADPAAWMSPGAYERNFAKGAASRIAERCKALREEATAPAPSLTVGSSRTALVLASFYDSERKANQLWLQQAGITTRATTNRQFFSTSAGFQEGRAFGDRLNLNSNTTLSSSTTNRKALS